MKREIIIYAIFIIIFNIFLIKAETINDIRRKVQEQIRKLNSRDNLYNLLDKGGIFNCENIYCTQISLLNSQYIDEQSQKFPQIYPLNIGDNYVVVKIFTKHIFPEESKNYLAGINAISDIVYFNLYNYEYDIINSDPVDFLTFGQKEIFVYLPLYVDNSLKNKILSVLGQSESSGIENLIDYDIFNPNAKIYNDICTTITYSILPEDIYNQESIKNLDITLEQRKKYYFPGNLQLCPKNCIYKGIDRKTISSICQCNIEYLNIVEHNEYISFNFNENNFYNSDEDTYFSIDTLKCLPTVEWKNNSGLFIILIIAAVILFCFILIFIKGKNYIIEVLNTLYNYNIKDEHENKISEEMIINSNEANNADYINKKEKENKDGIKSGERYLNINLMNKEKIISKETEKTPEESQASNIKIKPIVKNENKETIGNNIINQIPSINEKDENKAEIFNNYIRENNTERIKFENENKKNKSINKLYDLFFSEQELNSMFFKESLKYDKRSFINIYISFLNMKQPLFFLINYYPKKEEGKFIIKFNTLKFLIICFEIMIYLLIYSSFFGSKSITEIYYGNFNFGKQFVLGIKLAPFAMIIKSLVYYCVYDLMYKKIIDIKISCIEKFIPKRKQINIANNQNEEFNQLKSKLINKFKIQLLIFFILSVLILLFDCLLVTSFCSVYKNTKLIFFMSILIGYLFPNIFSFVYCFILSDFRYYALKNNSKVLFNISEIIKII